jgi:hypothetical protein
MMKSSTWSGLVGELAWAITLATGFGTLWFALVAWTGESGGASRPNTWEQLLIWSDGTPIIEKNVWPNLAQTTYRDLKGNTQKALELKDRAGAVFMPGEHQPPGAFAGERGWLWRLWVFVDDRDPNAIWYFVHDGEPDGTGYFVGYHSKTKQRMGFIGLSGGRADPVPKGDQFPVRAALMLSFSSWSSAPTSIYNIGRQEYRAEPFDLPTRLVYVPSGKELREVDLNARTVTTVFESPDPIEAPGVATITNWSGGKPVREQPVLVRTRQRIFTIDRNHKVVRQFTIPSEIDPQSTVYWYEVAGGQAIANFTPPSATRVPRGGGLNTLYRIAADGAILERFEVTLQAYSDPGSEARFQTIVFLGLPVPAFIAIVNPLFLMGTDQSLSYPAAIAGVIRRLWPSLLGVAALTSILAIITWRRCGSFGLTQRERAAWLIFVLLLGLPAFVGFLLGRRWVVRQPCASCHALAPRDRDECAHCGTRFPDPSLLGIEIFA